MSGPNNGFVFGYHHFIPLQAANSALRGGEGVQPSVPHPFTKPYVEMLFKRSREDLLHRYRIEADALDNWHR
jgi:hypothetical protein